MTADGTYRSARAGETITTAAELDTLPVGSVVLDNGEDAWQRTPQGWVSAMSSESPMDAEQLAGWHAPLTVLFRPDAPKSAPTDDAAGGHLALLRQRYVGLVYADALDTEVAERAGHEFDQAIATALAAEGAGAKAGREALVDLQRIADRMSESRYSVISGIAAEMNDALLRLAARGDAATPTPVRRPRRVRPKCEACGHSIGSHNDLGYCTTGAGTPRPCDCDSYDDGLRRQPDGTLARPSATETR